MMEDWSEYGIDDLTLLACDIPLPESPKMSPRGSIDITSVVQERARRPSIENSSSSLVSDLHEFFVQKNYMFLLFESITKLQKEID